jgi:hypothetical protein
LNLSVRHYKWSWLDKLLAPMNMSPWKFLLLIHIEKYGVDKILYLKKEGLTSISEKLNSFWRDILLNLSKLLTMIKAVQEKDIINIFSQIQPLWLNFNKQKMVMFLLLINIVIMVSFLLMILFLKINSFVISGPSKQIYDKYKHSRILWYCGCSLKEMKKTYFRVWEAAWY